jgi:hypothetical protein
MVKKVAPRGNRGSPASSPSRLGTRMNLWLSLPSLTVNFSVLCRTSISRVVDSAQWPSGYRASPGNVDRIHSVPSPGIQVILRRFLFITMYNNRESTITPVREDEVHQAIVVVRYHAGYFGLRSLKTSHALSDSNSSFYRWRQQVAASWEGLGDIFEVAKKGVETWKRPSMPRSQCGIII